MWPLAYFHYLNVELKSISPAFSRNYGRTIFARPIDIRPELSIICTDSGGYMPLIYAAIAILVVVLKELLS